MNKWGRMVSDLREWGMTLAEIGQAVGLAASSVSDIQQERTQTPNGDAAVRIHELHKKRARNARRAGRPAA